MIIGIGLSVLAGFLGGSALLPLRYTTRWSFENVWFIWCLLSFIIAPLIIVIGFVPSYLKIYEEVGSRMLIMVIGAGFIAGIAAFLTGYSVSKIGIAGSNAIANGLALALGSIIPMIIQHKEVIKSTMFVWLMLGLVLSVAGVIVFALASHYRDQNDNPRLRTEMNPAPDKKKKSRDTLLGIVAAFGAGLLYPGINLGIAFADEYMKVAVKYGSSEAIMTYVFYLPYYIGAFFSNTAYSVVFWFRKRTYREIGIPGTRRIITWIFIMSFVWTISNLLYGWAMPAMKGMGPVLGWPVYLAVCSIGAVIIEICLGDWKGKALKVMLMGMIVLTLSITIFALCSMHFT
jgi:hypothetical protein